MKQIKIKDQSIDDYFVRNTIGLSAVEFFWGLANPVIFESAFLQIFLKQLGASNKTVGLIPAILTAGIMLSALLSSWLTSHLVHKKRAVIITHIASSIPLLLFGIILPYVDPSSRVGVFLVSYIVFALSLGIVLPLWQNFIVKIFSMENTLKANSIMMTTQIFARLLGSLCIFKSVEKYSFSINSASLIFIAVGCMYFIGSTLFAIVHEQSDPNPSRQLKPHNLKTMGNAVKHILHNKNYLKFLAGMTESYATIAVLSFYANYAVEFKGIDKSTAAGLFVACIYFSGILTNILLGWLNFFSLKTKFIIARTSAITGTLMLTVSNTLPFFMLISLILGVARAVNQSAYAPSVKLLSGLDDATDYFSISSVFIFPVSFTIPLFSGFILDLLAGYGPVSYVIVFINLAVLQSAGLFFTLFTDFNQRSENDDKA